MRIITISSYRNKEDYLLTDEGLFFKWSYKYNCYLQLEGTDRKTKGKVIYKWYGMSLTSRMFKQYTAHRLVAKAFIPNTYGKPNINHIDGNGLNNHYKNLEWCTQKENVQHAVRTGLKTDNHTKGEISVHSKLKTIDVINIRHCYGSVSATELAKYYPVSKSMIRWLWQNHCWPEVKHPKLPTLS